MNVKMNSKHNTIGKGVEQRFINGGMDEYFTKQYVADFYSSIVFERYGDGFVYIDPTAGAGAFLKVIPNSFGFDIKPASPTVKKCDVFDNTFTKNTIIIGNPPFGFGSNMAVKVFNHVANFGVTAIAFILPKTFQKVSVQNRLNRNYHLVFEHEVVANAFLAEETIINVPTIFQIWEYRKSLRRIYPQTDCKWIEFVDKRDADIAIRRVGGRAGQVLDGLNHTESSTYFVKVKHEKVYCALKLIDLSVVEKTSGVKSISRFELCFELNKIMEVLIEC